MPIYEFRCSVCPETMTEYRGISTRDDAATCRCGESMKRMISAPMIMTDLPGYESPVTGKWIEGRKARLEDLRRTGSRPYEGFEQEKKEADRQRAYQEHEQDVALDAIIGNVIGGLKQTGKFNLE